MATELATAYIRLMPSARGFRQAVDNEIGSDLTKAGEKAGDDTSSGFNKRFGSGIKKGAAVAATGFAAAFVGAAVLGKQAVDAASGLEEAQSKVNVVFGDGAGEIAAWAKTASKSMGQSQRQALEAAGTYGNLFQAFGIGQKPAQEMSTTLAGLASDLASFNNTSVDEALQALQSGISGETEPLKRYGIAISQTRLEAEALRLRLVDTTVDQNALSKAQEASEKATRKVAEAAREHGRDSQQYKDAVVDQEQAEAALAKVMDGKVGQLTEAQKAQASYSLIMQDSSLAQGDFERTSDGLANSQRIMAAEFENAKASLGEALLPVVTKVVSFISANIPKAIELFKGFGRVIGEGLDYLRGGFSGEFTNEGEGILLFLNQLGMAAREVFDWFKRNWPTIRDVAQAVLTAVGEAIMFVATEVIPRVITAFKTVVEWVRTNWPTIRDTAMSVFNALRDAWENVLRPTFNAIVAGVQWVVDWVRDHWGEISERVSGVFGQISEIVTATFETIRTIVTTAVTVVQTIWRNFGNEILDVARVVWDQIYGVVSAVLTTIKDFIAATLDIIHNVIKTVMALIRGDWGDAWDGIKGIFSGVWDQIKAVLTGALSIIETTLRTAVASIKLVWEGIVGVLTFFKERVEGPIGDAVTRVKDAVTGAFQTTVDTVKSIWNGIADIASFFKREVYDRVVDVVWKVKDAVASAFQAAVDAVKLAWDKLRDIVKLPINGVIGFYNNGIRAVWNAVISKIPGVGDLNEVSYLASGGWVPGSGNRDTVPAMLTPGEFVVTKKAAQVWGPQVLAALNSGRGTIDPGVFGYATGGFVHGVDDALEWARAQAGKPYRFPDVGPDTFDCSGFTSALLNYILGVNPPWRRRHSSGTVGSDPALARGVGPENGLMLGAKPPFTTNAQGASVGHVAATLAGVNMEATPPRVLVGIGARGATNGMFTGLFHLPGYGGLSDDDKAIATSVQGLQGMAVSGLTAPLGDLLQTMFNKLPGMVFDFFMKKLPGAIVDAITGAIGGLFRAVTPFANGGTAWRNGPTLYGERGPELGWASKGMYIESTEDLMARGSTRSGGVNLTVQGSILGEADFRRFITSEVETMDFRRRAAPLAGVTR